MNNNYDAIVVGSGAGGGTIAYELSKRGKKVLIIEAGREINPFHLGRFWPMVIWPGYYHRLGALNRSVEGTIIYCTRNVGGTTVVSCGNMIRSLETEFASLGIYLRNAFQEVEQEIEVMPIPKGRNITGTKAIMEAAQNLGHNMLSMPKGMVNMFASCNICGNCVLGCSRQAKWDARFYIKQAVENRAKIMSSTRVRKILFSGIGRVKGVLAWGPNGEQKINSELVILSAGGLGTPVILRNSGIPAGKGLFIDPFNVTYGITSGLNQLKGVSMGAVLDYHKEGGFILSPFIDHLSQQLLFCPSWWNLVYHFPRTRMIGIMAKIADEREGEVYADGSFSKLLTARDHSHLKSGAEMAAEILKQAGAKSIITTKHPRGAHPGGTAAIGEIVDNNLQVVGCDGLYVCDASVFPEAPGLPPILTTVALAKWLGKKLTEIE